MQKKNHICFLQLTILEILYLKLLLLFLLKSIFLLLEREIFDNILIEIIFTNSFFLHASQRRFCMILSINRSLVLKINILNILDLLCSSFQNYNFDLFQDYNTFKILLNVIKCKFNIQKLRTHFGLKRREKF